MRVLFALALFGAAAHAQNSPAASAAYAEGLALAAEADWGAAARAFEQAVHADPAHIGGVGTAAFWLGYARDRAGDEGALEAWAAGRQALAARGLHAPRLDSALVAAAFAEGAPAGEAQVLACDAFLDLLDAGDALRLGDHLGPLALVIPARLAASATPGGLGEGGAEIAAWWRQQDPRPGTPLNERLAEHLARVAHARQAYADGDGALDARGEIWVRFGPPSRTTRILVGTGAGSTFLGGRIPSFRPSEVPLNEVWAYPGVDETAVYLFVRRSGDAYELGTPDDLVPRSLTVGLGTSERGTRKSSALLFVLESVYRQLADFDPRYAPHALDLSVYTDLLETAEREAMLAAAASEAEEDPNRAAVSLSAPRSAQALISALPQPPSVAAMGALVEAGADGEAFAAERSRRVPPSQTALREEAVPLPVSLRWARFLSASGRTLVETYWAIPPHALRFSEMDLLHVGWHAVEEGIGGRPLARHRTDLLAPAAGPEVRPGSEEFPPQAYTFATSDETTALAMEWAVSAAAREGDRVRVGDLAALAVLRVDSLAPLRVDGIEMSDLKPVRAVVNEPYPHARLSPGDPIHLYFEIYGLRENAGPSGFIVEYEVVRRREGSLLRRARETTQEGDLVSTVEGTRAAEYLILNTTTWTGADEVEVVVRVRDAATGDQAERRIRFGVAE